MRFRKKPLEVEAFELTKEVYTDTKSWPTWMRNGGAYVSITKENVHEVMVPTLNGVTIAYEGDFVILGLDGEIYPNKRHIFLATYDPV